MIKTMNSILKALLWMLAGWVIFVSAEGIRLIGSTDPGKYLLIYIGGVQTQDKQAKYGSLGFTLDYHLAYENTFVSGEFRVLGIVIARWVQ